MLPTGSRTAMLPAVCPGTIIDLHPNTSSPSPTATSGRGAVMPARSSARRAPPPSRRQLQDGRGAPRVVAMVVGQDHVPHRAPVQADGRQRRLDGTRAALQAGIHDGCLAVADEDIGGHEPQVDALPSSPLRRRGRPGCPTRPARRRAMARRRMATGHGRRWVAATPTTKVSAVMPRPRSAMKVRRAIRRGGCMSVTSRQGDGSGWSPDRASSPERYHRVPHPGGGTSGRCLRASARGSIRADPHRCDRVAHAPAWRPRRPAYSISRRRRRAMPSWWTSRRIVSAATGPAVTTPAAGEAG